MKNKYILLEMNQRNEIRCNAALDDKKHGTYTDRGYER